MGNAHKSNKDHSHDVTEKEIPVAADAHKPASDNKTDAKSSSHAETKKTA